MKKNIAVSKEVREKIAKIFKVTERHVFNALNLDYPETDIVRRIYFLPIILLGDRFNLMLLHQLCLGIYMLCMCFFYLFLKC